MRVTVNVCDNKQLLSLQTEEGPSPAAAHHIEHLPTVSVQQQTVGQSYSNTVDRDSNPGPVFSILGFGIGDF